jgi:hypothetical protein
MNQLTIYPPGEAPSTALTALTGPVAVDTCGGRIHVEWDSQAAVTPLGQLPFFRTSCRSVVAARPGWPVAPCR